MAYCPENIQSSQSYNNLLVGYDRSPYPDSGKKQKNMEQGTDTRAPPSTVAPGSTTNPATSHSADDAHHLKPEPEGPGEGGEGGGGGGGEGDEGGGKEERGERGETEGGLTVTIEQTGGVSLQRSIGLLGAISFTIGTMIGSGIFITPTSVLRNTQSVALNIIVWIFGGVISLFGSFTFAELACRVPKHGGMYAYLNEGFGAWLAFIYSWTNILILGPTSLAVKCLTFARYFMTMAHLCGTPELPVTFTAVTLIVTLCVLNMTSNVLSVRTNVVFLFSKVLALFIIIVGGIIVLIKGDNEDSELTSGFAGTTDSPASIAKSFYFVMWAYGGWDSSNSIVEEVKDPSRNVPLASILGVLVVTVIYVLTNVSYLAVMSMQQMLAADTVAVTWGNAVLGTGVASFIIPLCVMTSTAGSSNSGIFVVPRNIFAASRDGNFPEVFCYLHVNSRIPLMSVSLIITLGIVYASSSDIIALISVSGAVRWLFFFLCSLTLLILRYRQPKDLPVAYKQPLPGVLFFMLFSLFLVVVPLTEGVDYKFYFTMAFYFVGLVVFFVYSLLKDRLHCGDGLVTFLQLLMRVCPPSPYHTDPTPSATVQRLPSASHKHPF